MHSQETYEWIERYLAGACSATEAADLEAKAAADPDLMALIELHRELEETLADADALDFSKKLAEADAEYHAVAPIQLDSSTSNATSAHTTKPFNWQVWGIAASIAILIGIGSIFFFNRDGNATPEALFSEYFSPSLAPSQFRSDEDVLEKRYQEAFDAYNRKAYGEAATTFEAIYQSTANQKTAEFYAAISLLAAGQTDRAIPLFEGFISKPNTYKTESEWYLAMAWLQKAAPDKAKPYLQAVSEKSGKHQAEAQTILDKLD